MIPENPSGDEFLEASTEIEKDWRPFVGTRVMIKGDRPWSGYSGIVVEHTSYFGKSLIVRLDNGQRLGVTSPDEIEIVVFRSGT